MLGKVVFRIVNATMIKHMKSGWWQLVHGMQRLCRNNRDFGEQGQIQFLQRCTITSLTSPPIDHWWPLVKSKLDLLAALQRDVLGADHDDVGIVGLVKSLAGQAVTMGPKQRVGIDRIGHEATLACAA